MKVDTIWGFKVNQEQRSKEVTVPAVALAVGDVSQVSARMSAAFVGNANAGRDTPTHLWPCKGRWIEAKCLYECEGTFRQNASGAVV